MKHDDQRAWRESLSADTLVEVVDAPPYERGVRVVTRATKRVLIVGSNHPSELDRFSRVTGQGDAYSHGRIVRPSHEALRAYWTARVLQLCKVALSGAAGPQLLQVARALDVSESAIANLESLLEKP